MKTNNIKMAKRKEKVTVKVKALVDLGRMTKGTVYDVSEEIANTLIKAKRVEKAGSKKA